jgi:hypothetical protein
VIADKDILQMREDINAVSRAVRILTKAVEEHAEVQRKALEEMTLNFMGLAACLMAHGVLKEEDLLKATREFRELGIDAIAKMVGVES